MADGPSEYTVAIAALVLGGAAFIIAFLQVLLQYLSSASGRWKCTKAAIGSARKHVRYSWSFRGWKIRVLYPLLDLDFNAVRNAMVAEGLQRLFDQKDFLDSLVVARGSKKWRPLDSDRKLSRWYLCTDSAVLVDTTTGALVHFKELPWKKRLLFLWYRIKHWRKPPMRPRASWAQLLAALGITDVTALKITLIDSETVASQLDTPLQRVKLHDLGKIAFVLGFNRVQIDIPNRSFSAFGPVASITTEEVPVVGKVLRFDGDSLALRRLMDRCNPLWVHRASKNIVGEVSFGCYVAHGWFHPLTAICHAIETNMRHQNYEDFEREVHQNGVKSFAIGPVLREAHLLKDLFSNLITLKSLQPSMNSFATNERTDRFGLYVSPREYETAGRLSALTLEDRASELNVTKDEILKIFEVWQFRTESRVPTIYAASTFMTIHSYVCAYPSRPILHAVLPWVRYRAQQLRTTCSYLVSDHFSAALASGALKFARENSPHLMSTNEGGDSTGGISGWGVSVMVDFLTKMPEELQREIIPRGDASRANAVLTQETADLLCHLEIQKWANDVTEKGWAFFQGYRVINLLWIQVVLLDIAIQYYLSDPFHVGADSEEEGHPSASPTPDTDPETEENLLLKLLYSERWASRSGPIVRAVVNAWRPQDAKQDLAPESGGTERPGSVSSVNATVSGDETPLPSSLRALENPTAGERPTSSVTSCGTTLTTSPSLLPWELAKHLELNSGVLPQLSGEKRRDTCRHLANLLELRAIYVIAFLFMHPDSSDVYLTEREVVEMPMA